MGATLMNELEALFLESDAVQGAPKDMGEQVVSIVSRWRQSIVADQDLVGDSTAFSTCDERDRWTKAEGLLGQLAESAHSQVGHRRFSSCRSSILASWSSRLDVIVEGEATDIKSQRQAMQERLLDRHRKREHQRSLVPQRAVKRWSSLPRDALHPQVSQQEVRRKSCDGENVAKFLLKQCDEEAEQQARSLFKKAEARRTRRFSRSDGFELPAAPSSPSKGESRETPANSSWSSRPGSTGLGAADFNVTGSSWAWARRRDGIDVSAERGMSSEQLE
jgi:hypothetical protein